MDLAAFALDGGGGIGQHSRMQLSPAVLAFAIFFALLKADLSAFAWGDYLMFGIFIAAMVWFSLPRRDQPAGHQQASEKVAFRLGKALNRVWRGSGRSA